MNSREVAFLRRLVTDHPVFRASEGVAAAMAATEGVGTVSGSRVLYTGSDFTKAANILTTRGYDTEAQAGSFSRSEAPKGGSEKSGALNVTEGLVACRGISMDSQLKLAGAGFAAIRGDDALALDFDVLLVCENLESLIHLERYLWLKPFYKSRRVLALFRGTKTWFTTAAAAAVMKESAQPTLAFFDFDPKGLSMAASLPRREALCLPELGALERRALELGRQGLFTNSAQDCRAHLDSVTDPAIAEAWKLMKRLTLGLNQEQF